MKIRIIVIFFCGISLIFNACKAPEIAGKTETRVVPDSFNGSLDSTNSARVKWSEYFSDPKLKSLIEIALENNQELNITLQEIEISKNEIMARKGEYLPFLNYGAGAGVDKVARYTNIGALEKNIDIKPGRETPEPLTDFMGGIFASWEVDIWHKLRNARQAAVNRYLGTIGGKNFMVTNLIAEIANTYYELLALDSQLEIIKQNIQIQSNALKVVKLQKDATRVTELAVRRFQAQVLNTQEMQYEIQQKIVVAENKINFLLGRYPQPVLRDTTNFNDIVPNIIKVGNPTQILQNRPDIIQAEQELQAAKIEVTVARANFYPRLGLSAGLGLQAFNPVLLVNPRSILTNLAGDLMGPLVNKNAIKATYFNANAKQIQAIYNYERTVLNAYIEVVNQFSNIANLQQSYNLKTNEVLALTQSINIANSLFNSARADYMEVLLTQRDALESRFDLAETKMRQLNASVNIYRALGGGWN